MSDTRQYQEELFNYLRTAAAYNDKGFIWSGHNEAQVAELRKHYQANMDRLVGLIGEQALGADLAEAIRSGEAARDDSGKYVEIAWKQFKLPPLW